MRPQEKIEYYWTELYKAVQKGDITNVVKYAMALNYMRKKGIPVSQFEKNEVPVIQE